MSLYTVKLISEVPAKADPWRTDASVRTMERRRARCLRGGPHAREPHGDHALHLDLGRPRAPTRSGAAADHAPGGRRARARWRRPSARSSPSTPLRGGLPGRRAGPAGDRGLRARDELLVLRHPDPLALARGRAGRGAAADCRRRRPPWRTAPVRRASTSPLRRASRLTDWPRTRWPPPATRTQAPSSCPRSRPAPCRRRWRRPRRPGRGIPPWCARGRVSRARSGSSRGRSTSSRTPTPPTSCSSSLAARRVPRCSPSKRQPPD